MMADQHIGILELFMPSDFFIPIPFAPDYQINQLGHIQKVKGDKIAKIKGWINSSGYRRVKLFNGEIHQWYVHRLVWTIFRGEIPEDREIHHLNDIRDDCRLENLQLVDRLTNIAFMWENR